MTAPGSGSGQNDPPGGLAPSTLTSRLSKVMFHACTYSGNGIPVTLSWVGPSGDGRSSQKVGNVKVTRPWTYRQASAIAAAGPPATPASARSVVVSAWTLRP